MDLFLFNEEFFDVINTKTKNLIFQVYDRKTNNLLEIEDVKKFAMIFKDDYMKIIQEQIEMILKSKELIEQQFPNFLDKLNNRLLFLRFYKYIVNYPNIVQYIHEGI